MIITRDILSDYIFAYLHGDMSHAALVDWAENTFIDDELAPEEDTDLLNDILAYIAASDTAGFPLTWDICAEFMARLGSPVQVVRAVH
jgi:hypothetical protein